MCHRAFELQPSDNIVYYCYCFQLNAVHIFHWFLPFSSFVNRTHSNNNAHQYYAHFYISLVGFILFYNLYAVRRIQSSNSNVFGIYMRDAVVFIRSKYVSDHPTCVPVCVSIILSVTVLHISLYFFGSHTITIC